MICSGLARELLGQAHGLDDLAELALVGGALERPVGEEPGADELLGDRRGAARPAGDRVDTCRDDPDGIEAGVLPEALVLDRGRRVDHLARDLVVGDDLAAERAELGELDLARPVDDARLLVELQVLERRGGVGQVGGVVVVGADGHDEASTSRKEGGTQEDDEDDDGDSTDDRATTPLGAALERSSMALAPREAGLHLWPHDSIGGVNERSSASRWVQTTRRSTL